jgi:hypothetical protein
MSNFLDEHIVIIPVGFDEPPARSKYETAAAEFAAILDASDILTRVEVDIGSAPGGSVITVHGRFAPGDTNAFLTAEVEASRALRLMEMTYPGTVWGTDSGSVGGHAGLAGGHFRLSKSGVGARFARALAKAISVGRLTCST